jgi:hypothetical protein
LVHVKAVVDTAVMAVCGTPDVRKETMHVGATKRADATPAIAHVRVQPVAVVPSVTVPKEAFEPPERDGEPDPQADRIGAWIAGAIGPADCPPPDTPPPTCAIAAAMTKKSMTKNAKPMAM